MKPSPRNRQPQLGVGVAWLCLTVIGISPQHGSRLLALEPFPLKHTEEAASVAFSPDGKTLASACFDGTIKLWDVATCKEQAALKGHTEAILSMAFSPDGKTLASGSDDKTVNLWDVTTGKVRATLKGHTEAVISVAFNPDSSSLASASSDKTIILWDVTSGKARTTLKGHVGVVWTVAFSPDGKTLASGSEDKTIKLWDMTTGNERVTLQGHMDVVWSVAFSPDGKTLASAGKDMNVRLWDVATGRERVSLKGGGPVAFSPDGKMLVSGTDLWEVATRKSRDTLRVHNEEIISMAFSPDGKMLASASMVKPFRDNTARDKSVMLWDVPATKKPKARPVLDSIDLDELWTTLAGEDAAIAFQAVGKLYREPDNAVPLAQKRLRPASKPNTQDITRLIADLDSKQFAVREKATEELEKNGEMAEPALRTKLADNPSLEVQRRIEKLLTRLEPQDSSELLRSLRALELLEYIGTSEAKQVLETLATGAEAARLTTEAKASLNRLNKRVPGNK